MVRSHLVSTFIMKGRLNMSELNTNAIPAINAVEGFNPADFVRNTVGEEGENDLYLDVKYRLLWFRLHCPNGKIDPELVHLDEKSAVVCCKVYADKADPADFVRNTVGEEGESDLYLDVKYRLLWFRLHCPNGKIDPELVHLDEKSAVVCCKVYADKADPADQFIGKAYSQRFPTEERFGDRFLEIAETVAKGRALADAGYGTQFCKEELFY